MSNPAASTATQRFLAAIEAAGNRLPDPAMLFLSAMLLVWLISWLLAGHAFSVPALDGARTLAVENQLSGPNLATFLASMVKTFTGFAPLGVVLVALLGVGVAEHTGFINAGLKALLGITPARLLTPMLLLVAIVSHTAADAGYVLVIPLGGIIFYAAGRHPLAGIACAFAGVSGGFGANFIPSAASTPCCRGSRSRPRRFIEPGQRGEPAVATGLFTSASSSMLVDRPSAGSSPTGSSSRGLRDTPRRRRGRGGKTTPWRRSHRARAPRAQAGRGRGDGARYCVALIPRRGARRIRRCARSDGTHHLASRRRSCSPSCRSSSFSSWCREPIYGYVAGTVSSHRDIIAGMTNSMQTMGYYLVMIFFCAQFTYAFSQSNLGALLAVEGADLLKAMALPGAVTLMGIIVLTALVNLLVGSASGKWALLAPIFVPVLMQLGMSPELTQAAYRVGDSSTNIVTPLMPYFPLVVAYCQRWVSNTGIGTVTALMIPYAVTLLIGWSLFLVAYWALNIPLGLAATYVYP